MYQKIRCHEGKCVDETYEKPVRKRRDLASEIEYDLLKDGFAIYAGGF